MQAANKARFYRNDAVYIMMACLIFVFHFINNYIWLSFNGNIQLGCDVVHHLYKSVDFYDKLEAIIKSGLWQDGVLEKILKLFAADTHWWPKLLDFTTSIFYLLFGLSDFVARMSNMFYFAILIISSYLIGRELFDRNTGIAAVFMLSFYPGVFGLSRLYGADYPLMAILALNMYAFIKSDTFKNLAFSVLFGFAAGLGILTKGPFVFFLFGPLCYACVSIFYAKEPMAEKLLRLFNFAIFAVIALLVSSVWWGWDIKFSFDYILRPTWFPAMGDYSFFFGKSAVDRIELLRVNTTFFKPFTYRWSFYYIYMIFTHLGYFYSVVFFLGLGCLLASRNTKAKIILIGAWFVIPYGILTVISSKWGRYFFPVFPVMALVSAYGFMSIRLRAFKIISAAAVIFISLFQFYRLSFGFIPQVPARFLYYWPSKAGVYNPCDLAYSNAPVETDYEQVMKNVSAAIKDREGSGRRYSVCIATTYNDFGDEAYLLYYLMRLYCRDANIVCGDGLDDFTNSCENFDYLILIQRPHEMAPSFDKIKFFPRLAQAENPECMRMMEGIKKYFKDNYYPVEKFALVSYEVRLYLVKKGQ